MRDHTVKVDTCEIPYKENRRGGGKDFTHILNIIFLKIYTKTKRAILHYCKWKSETCIITFSTDY